MIVCSNFSYDGQKIDIIPNPVFKVVIKNSLSNKKLLEKTPSENFLTELHDNIIEIPFVEFFKIQGIMAKY